jgi:prepilin-type N-terminal cleavage/methylation domain-containing protein
MKTITVKRGFTIVELLIVIVVIGILAAITIVAYNGIQNRAVETAVLSDLNTFQKQIELTGLLHPAIYDEMYESV